MATIIALVALTICGLLIYAMTQPNTFRVERSTTINAPAEKVFSLINDLTAWENWSPWAKRDPAMKKTSSGPASGVGAIHEWDGNKQVGKGRMEIIGSNAPDKVALKLDFLKPFEAHNQVEFSLSADGAATSVTWAMFGPMPFVSKLMSIFVSMDKMCGKDFDTGLANLKQVAES